MSNPIVPAAQPSVPAIVAPKINAADMIAAHADTRKWIRNALVPVTDYGTIPGTKNETILKPGIDKILVGFQLHAEALIVEKEVDHTRENVFFIRKWVPAPDADPTIGLRGAEAQAAKNKAKEEGTGGFRTVKKDGNETWVWHQCINEKGNSIGLYRYVIKVNLYNSQGILIGEGSGICSSLESKYIRNPHDAEHTIYSMAVKRARAAATIATLGLSDMFSGDIADAAEDVVVLDPSASTAEDTPVQAPQEPEAPKLEIAKQARIAFTELGIPPAERREFCKGFANEIEAFNFVVSGLEAGFFETADQAWEARAEALKLIIPIEPVISVPPAEAPATPEPSSTVSEEQTVNETEYDRHDDGHPANLMALRLGEGVHWAIRRGLTIETMQKLEEKGLTREILETVERLVDGESTAEIIMIFEKKLKKDKK
jgi:hypothetical protein